MSNPFRQAAALPEGWIEQFDLSTNKKYYANTTTGETQWTPPTPTVSAPAAAPSPVSSSAGLPEGWMEQVRESIQMPMRISIRMPTHMSHSHMCMQQSAHTPVHAPMHMSMYVSMHTSVHMFMDAHGRTCFHPQSDPSTGRKYYCNTKTGQTQWEMPTSGGASLRVDKR